MKYVRNISVWWTQLNSVTIQQLFKYTNSIQVVNKCAKAVRTLHTTGVSDCSSNSLNVLVQFTSFNKNILTTVICCWVMKGQPNITSTQLKPYSDTLLSLNFVYCFNCSAVVKPLVTFSLSKARKQASAESHNGSTS
jgi:hypothetical protein